MNLSCTQENLNRGVSLVSHLAGIKGSLPILSNLLLKTDKGRLKISATDLEIGVNTWIGAKVEKEGAVTVPARLFQEFVSTNDDKTINLVLENTSLNLKSKRYEANIKGIDSSEFPLIPDIKKKVFAYIDSSVLGEAISQTVFACALDATRPVLTGVVFQFRGNELKIAATDSYRLAEKRIKLDSKIERDAQIIIPQRSVLELSRMLSTSQGRTDIYLGENQILFVFDETEFVSRLIEGTFPDYAQIIPKDFRSRAKVSKMDFYNTIKMASFFAREVANNIKLIFEKNSLKIAAASSQIGDNLSKITAQTSGPPIEIAFNAKFILDFLNNVAEEEIIIEASSKSSPVVFKPEKRKDYLYIIMPLKTEE